MGFLSGVSEKLAANFLWYIMTVVGSMMFTAVVGVAQRIWSGSLDWWVLGALFVISFCLLGLAGLIYQRRKKSEAQSPVVTEQERVSSAVAALIKHREWAVHHLLNMPVQSAPDLARWVERRDWWRKQVVEDLRKVCSEAEVSRFDVVGTCTLELHSNAYNFDRQGLHSEHNLSLSLLNRDLKMLLEIIDKLQDATARYRLQ